MSQSSHLSVIWRGDSSEQGGVQDYTTEVSEGMVVLDAVHRIQAEQAADLAVRWNCKAGKCGSCSAEINGKPRLMCMTRLDSIDLTQPVTVEPMKAFPLIRDLVTDVSWNYAVKKRDQAVQATAGRRAGRHLADAPARGRPRAGVPEVHRVLPLPGRLPHPARPPPARPVHRPALPALQRRARDAPARYRRPARAAEGSRRHRLLQHHPLLHERVPRAHHDHRERDHPAQGAGRRSLLRSADEAAQDVQNS